VENFISGYKYSDLQGKVYTREQNCIHRCPRRKFMARCKTLILLTYMFYPIAKFHTRSQSYDF
jgi:hypothetical protein